MLLYLSIDAGLYLYRYTCISINIVYSVNETLTFNSGTILCIKPSIHAHARLHHTHTQTHPRVLCNWAVRSVLAESPVSHHHRSVFSVRLACACSSAFTGKPRPRTNRLVCLTLFWGEGVIWGYLTLRMILEKKEANYNIFGPGNCVCSCLSGTSLWISPSHSNEVAPAA